MNQIAVFASGEGSNADWIFRFFKDHDTVKVSTLYCNKVGAPVLEKAFKRGIPVKLFNKEELNNKDLILKDLIEKKIDLIVLAGFLWLIPEKIIEEFDSRIINIHPSLLPKYGGEGMYGSKVFEEVLKNKDKMSGITIHYVNKKFDEGEIIYQAKCRVEKDETLESLAAKVHRLEHHYYPIVIERILKEQDQIRELL
jgi:phosphoribosylglycinamide formyltransferase-1